MKTMLPIAMSDIHVHLEVRHVEALFGRGHALTKWRDLSIPGQFACRETVEVLGPAGRIPGAVRVPGERGLVFEQVVIRVSQDYALEMHVDVEEGRAAGVVDFQLVELLR